MAKVTEAAAIFLRLIFVGSSNLPFLMEEEPHPFDANI
jgi:hypothetical protein